ncbi:hypothetical protein [Klebsiella pneumoniae]|uniref:hypothetical protein n=1 Tax=Klebsiella pneumoniae TaxID=573 RepID=UPI001D188E24|nr:hypothetical protein [Klebsiella pneumoniae]
MALYMVFIEDAEDRNGERCIMPTSEHLEDMVVLAWQTGRMFSVLSTGPSIWR